MEADIYWHSRWHRWSVRVGGRVVDHLESVSATRCVMVVRETERQRASPEASGPCMRGSEAKSVSATRSTTAPT